MASADQPKALLAVETPWDDKVLISRIKLRRRKPDAIGEIKAEIAKLDRHMQALSLRRELIVQNITENREEAMALESQADALSKQLVTAAAAMKKLSDMLRSQKAALLDIDEGMTPEMEGKPRQEDYLQKLFDDGKLNGQQLDAARNIARIYEATATAGAAKITRMDGVSAGGSGGFQDVRLPETLALNRAKFYLPWGLHLREHAPITLDIVLRIVVFGLAVRVVARHSRMRQEAAETKLREGLDAYWKPCSCHDLRGRREGSGG